MSSERQLAGAGNVVGVKIGSRVFRLFVAPTEDATSLLKVFGISPTEGIGVDEDSTFPGQRAFLLRPISPNFGMEAEHARQSLLPAGADLTTEPPQLEIVDLNDPNFEIPLSNHVKGTPA